jgi:hypothetical protein
MDTYDFSDGDTRTMASRWSAVVVKKGGKWKLASLHIGVNAFDNPVLSALKDGMPKIGAIGAVIGLVLGLGLSKAFCKTKTA